MKKNFAASITGILIVSAVLYIILYSVLPNNRVVPAFDEGDTHLVIGGDYIVTRNEPKILSEEILLPIDIVKKHIDPYIFWDEKLKKVTITTQDKVIRMKTDNLSAMVNNKPVKLNIPVKIIDSTVYIPIKFLSDLYGVEIMYIPSTGVVVIDAVTSSKKLAEPVKENAVIRKGHSKHNPIIKKLDAEYGKKEKLQLRVFGEYDKWYKVRTPEGLVGYIEKRFTATRDITVDIPKKHDSRRELWSPGSGRINLVWEMIYQGSPDLSRQKKIEGLDVLSPTWFRVINVKGELSNGADPAYVEWAHKSNYKVWALFSNGFGDIELTSKFLNNTDSRDNAIRQLLAYAALYKLDGINIDFENIYKRDKDALTQFVREITPLLKQQGLVVSIDISVPDGSETYSLCYDREALGEIVDYVILMAYDQHWRTSPVAGSVAEVSWVEENINKTLKFVPAEKLILGMPFYTRLWKEEKGTDGKVKVSGSTGLSMKKAKASIDDYAEKVLWDEKSGQYYAEYSKDGAVFKIWYENEDSINLKSSLVLKYRLAGAAAWSKNNETPEVWQVLKTNLKEISSYEQWSSINRDKKYVYNQLD
ncbi:MAG: glycosyl hydrolase family 18 protein [Clostridia bacterium]|nr:glycosyl hydrolase family 18 protein [Clostridia bacterium]